MGKDIHDIELFRRLIAPRHTAFNVRISEKSSADEKQRSPNQKRKNLHQNDGVIQNRSMFIYRIE